MQLLRGPNCCVYGIWCKINDKTYIGATVELYRRCRMHLSELRRGVHHCSHLQASFTKYGEHNFEFVVLEEANTENLYILEREWWRSWPSSKRFGQLEPSGVISGVLGNDYAKDNGWKLLLVDSNRNVLNVFRGTRDAGKYANRDNTNISRAINKQGYYKVNDNVY